MKQEIIYFFTALVFFTRVPSPIPLPYSAEILNHSSRYFPLVGILVGAAGALVFEGAALLLPKSVAVLLSMVATILVTGAFHEDGFADVCDGFGGGWTKERILEIMKDSRVGAFGAIGMCLMLAMKFFCLYEIPLHLMPWAIVGAHAFSRFTAITFLYTDEYAREEGGKAKPLATKMKGSSLLVAAVFGTAPLLMLPHFYLVPLPALVARLLLGRYFNKWIGGFTGDCLGATQQVAELAIYMAILGVLKI